MGEPACLRTAFVSPCLLHEQEGSLQCYLSSGQSTRLQGWTQLTDWMRPLSQVLLPPMLECRLAVPLGVAPTTGMGLALNGGFSIMSRMNGLTCDNTLEVQMVLADGSLVSQRPIRLCGEFCVP